MVYLANAYSRSKAYVSFQVRVSPELKEELVKKSFETGISQGAIVASALRYYLSANLDPRNEPHDEDEGNNEGT